MSNPLVRRQPDLRFPLVGTFVKRIIIKPYKAKSIAKAIKLGKYDYHHDDIDIVKIFADDEVGLTKEVGVDLFQYDQNWSYKGMLIWAKENGNKKQILLKHILGIGIHFSGMGYIVETGTVRRGCALGIGDFWGQNALCLHPVNGGWVRTVMVGFLSEPGR
jgi:hypothetical protein